MIFTRTGDGLANEHLFYEVEYVVHCEGEEVEGEGNSFDEAFWAKVFERNGKKVRCHSRGSKSDLRKMARRIVNGKIDNVIVAMDRDYDHLQGFIIDHKRVIYTYGYSWENDVVAQIDFPTILAMFATVATPDLIKSEYEAFYSEQSKYLRRIFALDFKYMAYEESLFDRGNPNSIIESGGSAAPRIKRKLLIDKARGFGKFQTGPLPAAVYRSACGVSNFHGKTVAKLIYRWFVFRTRNIHKTCYGAFMSLLIQNISMGSDSHRDAHYSKAISEIWSVPGPT